jgi:hypothetical protein
MVHLISLGHQNPSYNKTPQSHVISTLPRSNPPPQPPTNQDNNIELCHLEIVFTIATDFAIEKHSKHNQPK